LLDTNACIALINGTPASVRIRYEEAVARGNRIVTSSIVTYELYFGVAKSARPDNAKRLRAFFAAPIESIPFDDEDAAHAGEVRATLEIRGTTIGPYDVLIAAQAVRLKATLVTANAEEFTRVDGLNMQNWSA